LRFAGNITASERHSGNIVELKGLKIREVFGYDNQMFPARRDNFIAGWVRQKGCKALGYRSGDRLAGYGVVRACACVTGFKVGPLFVDSKEIAQEILSELARHVGKNDVFIDIPEPNQQALDLAKRNGMKKIFETVRMYNKVIPPLPLDRIYGVTTLELG
jgi:hypothetical protein